VRPRACVVVYIHVWGCHPLGGCGTVIVVAAAASAAGGEGNDAST